MPWGGLIAAGGSIFGGLLGAGASTSAARIASQASDRAIQAQLGVDQVIQGQLAPYLSAGTNALADYAGIIGPGGVSPESTLGEVGGMGFRVPGLSIPNPSDPNTINQFQQSPGYQWQLSQGIDALQNSAAGKTGAISGNMLKALQGYGTGLANQDWYNWLNSATQYGQNQFNAGRTNFWDVYNALATGKQQQIGNLQNLAAMGQGAATNSGQAGVQLAGNVGNALIGQGNAGAAGVVGSANAITGGINSALLALLSPNYSGGNNALSYFFGGGGGYNTPVSGAEGYPGGSPVY